MRDGRLGIGVAGAAAAVALALIAGCASPPPRRPFPDPSCPQRSAPDSRDLLPECVQEAPADPARTCVPIGVRGREIARDDKARLRAYETCIPDSETATPTRLRVDPGRVIVERTGAQRASEEDFYAIEILLRTPPPSRAPDPPGGRPPPREEPELSVPPQLSNSSWKDGTGYAPFLEMHVQERRPELPALLSAISKWLPRGDTCIAMEVDFGWREGCPLVNYRSPK